VAEPRARRFEYSVDVDGGRLASGRGATAEVGDSWTPEDFVLVALVRCSLTSFGYHARRAGASGSGRGSARGIITKRAEDGRFAFVEIDCRLDVRLDPPPEPDALRALLAKAERDCFIGASLTTKPAYRWRVNGGDVE
jgi:uncharacterized OsmC-like protein